MHTRTLGALVVATALMLTAACGGDDPEPATTATTEAAAGSQTGDAVAARAGDTDLGEILVGQDGLTLYGFTNDTDGTSTCTGTCADAWPPVLVGADWTVGPGLDTGVFSTIRREDGSEQLVAGKWPLYHYSGDSAPGDVKGQGSGDVWYVVGTDAALVKDPAAAAGETAGASVQVAGSSLGEILVDGEGNTLYGFTNDADGVPTCAGDCAATWPAHLVDGDPVLGAGLDQSVFTLVDGVEVGQQLKAGKWPLYRFSGDSAPGEVNGQGSGDVWFVVAADGSLVKDPPAGDSSGDSSGDDDGY